MKVLQRLRLIAALLALTLLATPAFAQATRTWVSGVGDDANPCSRTAPCKTFAGAISKTAAAGEINVLDPGGFGAVTITKSISIRADGVIAGVLVSGTNGIVVAAGTTDSVILSGLDIEGLGTGLSGVLYQSGAKLTIDNCTIHDFTTAGVTVSAASTMGLVATRLIVSDNRIGVSAAGSSPYSVVLQDSNVLNSSTANLSLTGSAARSLFVVSNTTLVGTTNLVGGTVTSFGNNHVIGGALSTQILQPQ